MLTDITPRDAHNEPAKHLSTGNLEHQIAHALHELQFAEVRCDYVVNTEMRLRGILYELRKTTWPIADVLRREA